MEVRGRIDDQIKLNGYRIELGEIESRLREREDVGDACVLIREDHGGHRRLVAWLSPAPGYATPYWQRELHSLPDGLRVACINSGEADLIHGKFSRSAAICNTALPFKPVIAFSTWAPTSDCSDSSSTRLSKTPPFMLRTHSRHLRSPGANVQLYDLDVRTYPMGIGESAAKFPSPTIRK